jgi:hypothetical protein
MKKITEQQGKSAFNLHQEILVLKRQMGVAFIKMGQLLKRIRDDEHYISLGFDSFKQYLSDSELGFQQRTAYYYIEIYEYFIEKLNYKVDELADIGYRNLVDVLSVAKKLSEPKKKMEDLMTDAKVLRSYDFKKKYRDEEKNKEFEEYLAPPEYFRCSKCGKWHVIIAIDDCCEEWLDAVYRRLKKRKGD